MAEEEYVEREKVLALQTDLHFDDIEQLKHWKCRHIDPTDVELLPAADVRHVVLCRDCIHARRYTNKIKCGYWSTQTASEIVCEDDFCSYGEKREES